jgi:selenocysteine lyase/cysteine desulfurase
MDFNPTERVPASMRPAKEREQIPALSRMTYLDNAGAGLPPTRVTEAMRRFVADWSENGEHWDAWMRDVVEARRLFGSLVCARRDEVGVLPSASVAISTAASALDLTKRKKVVTSALNFPTNVMMWQRMRESGLLNEVSVLQPSGGMVPTEDYATAVDDGTAVVAVDYVSWYSGARENIREISEIAHRHGALLLVDSFHALGVFPFDAKKDGIDVLVSGFYKWLCGPHGVACIYVDRELLEDLRPSYLGWLGVEGNVVDRMLEGRDPFDVPFPLDRAEPAATAARFEWGTWAAVCVTGAIEAMRFALENGIDYRFSRIKKIRGRIQEGFAEMGLEVITPSPEKNEGSGIVSFASRRQQGVVRALMKQNLVVSGRFGSIRASPHFYNTLEEADALLGALRPLVRKG